MAIRETVVDPKGGRNIRFPEHQLAHELLDGLTGIECGASSHNSFHLPGSRNVAPMDDFEFYKEGQADLNGKYAEIDIDAEAHHLPMIEDNSQGYVIGSHVFEHLPNPLGAIREWIRIIRDGGYIFQIVPLPGALDSDRGRALATSEDWLRADIMEVTVDTWAEVFPGEEAARRGHYFVYSNDSLKALIQDFWHEDDRQPWLELVASEDPDTKVSNGHTLVYKVHKPAPAPLKVFSVEDRTVEEVSPEDGTLHVEDFAQGGYVTDNGLAFIDPNVGTITREQAEELEAEIPPKPTKRKSRKADKLT